MSLQGGPTGPAPSAPSSAPGGKEGTYPSPGLGTERSSCSRPPRRDSSTPCKSPGGPSGVGGTPGPDPPPASRQPGPPLGGGAGMARMTPKDQCLHCNPSPNAPLQGWARRGEIRTQAVALIGHAAALGGVQHQGSSARAVIGADGVDAVPPHAGLGFFIQTLVVIWGDKGIVRSRAASSSEAEGQVGQCSPMHSRCCVS